LLLPSYIFLICCITVEAEGGVGTGADQPFLKQLSKLEERLCRLETNEMALASRMDSNEQSFLEFLGTYTENRGHDLYSIADQSERLDYLSNLARHNCVLLTGTV
jgi:hypothetical protein